MAKQKNGEGQDEAADPTAEDQAVEASAAPEKTPHLERHYNGPLTATQAQARHLKFNQRVESKPAIVAETKAA